MKNRSLSSLLVLMTVGAAGALAASACGSSDSPTGTDTDAGAPDGTVAPQGDGSAFDGGSSPGNDAGASDGGSVTDAAGPTYFDMTDGAAWSVFDTTTVAAGAKGFEGAAFDGRYIYFVPYTAGGSAIVTRYDTQASFDAGGAWSTFDLSPVVSNTELGFAGAVFDGRYVYLVPRRGPSGVVPRYDTQAPFAQSGSWSTFKTSAVDPSANGYVGGTFDGRYVYFAPYNNSANAYHGVVARYDTQGAFDAGSGWSTFDVSKVNPAATGYYGGVFDGRYVYLVPWINGTDGGVSQYSGVVARYDTQGAFDAGGGWTTYDTTALDPGAKGYGGGAFDGRYLYLVPSLTGLVVRLDTKATFGQASSWTTFDATKVNPSANGFTGATFDGRFVYFSPYANGADGGTTMQDGVVARYDTQQNFDGGAAWSTFNAATVNPKSVGFIGTVFDGRGVYFVPCTNGSYTGEVTRFEAKSPPSMPVLYGDGGPKFTGSFL